MDVPRLLRHLTVMAYGQSARECPAVAGESITLLPLWAELTPLIDVGAKAHRDPALTVPVRINWVESVVSSHRGVKDFPWSITGMGYALTGTVSVDAAVSSTPGPGASAILNGGPCTSEALQRLEAEGDDALWFALTTLEPYLRNKAEEASRVVATELGHFHGVSLLHAVDPVGIDGAVTHMLYGHEGDSIISRMLHRALEPQAFAACDPARYFSFNLRARALGEVRRLIGDPHIGVKFRRLRSAHPGDGFDALLARYNSLFPGDKLGRVRAIAALTANADAAANTHPLFSNPTPTLGDQ